MQLKRATLMNTTYNITLCIEPFYLKLKLLCESFFFQSHLKLIFTCEQDPLAYLLIWTTGSRCIYLWNRKLVKTLIMQHSSTISLKRFPSLEPGTILECVVPILELGTIVLDWFLSGMVVPGQLECEIQSEKNLIPP